jgi:hypothetical protein
MYGDQRTVVDKVLAEAFDHELLGLFFLGNVRFGLNKEVNSPCKW